MAENIPRLPDVKFVPSPAWFDEKQEQIKFVLMVVVEMIFVVGDHLIVRPPLPLLRNYVSKLIIFARHLIWIG